MLHLSVATSQIFPSNSLHALPLAYPSNCALETYHPTTRNNTPSGTTKKYCTTVGSPCTTSPQCVTIAQSKTTRLCPHRDGAAFTQCVDGVCRMKEQVRLEAKCDCLQGCQQGLGDWRSCFWGICVQCIPCGEKGGKRPCCPPGKFVNGVCTCGV